MHADVSLQSVCVEERNIAKFLHIKIMMKEILRDSYIILSE